MQESYGRISILSKPKYAGISTEDFKEIYCHFIRSKAKYCSVVFASSLTLEQKNKITYIEKTCLRIILQEMYIVYMEACEMLALTPLTERREARMLAFAKKKCVNHKTNSIFFPRNKNDKTNPELKQIEPYKVNFARTESN